MARVIGNVFIARGVRGLAFSVAAAAGDAISVLVASFIKVFCQNAPRNDADDCERENKKNLFHMLMLYCRRHFLQVLGGAVEVWQVKTEGFWQAHLGDGRAVAVLGNALPVMTNRPFYLLWAALLQGRSGVAANACYPVLYDHLNSGIDRPVPSLKFTKETEARPC